MMKPWRRHDLRDSIRPERVAAVREFGFTELQARFLLHVLIHSGVFIERQYRTFTGVTHGQRTKSFLTKPRRGWVCDRHHTRQAAPGPPVPRPVQAALRSDWRSE